MLKLGSYLLMLICMCIDLYKGVFSGKFDPLKPKAVVKSVLTSEY